MMVLPLASCVHALISKRNAKTDMLSPPSDTALLLEMFRGEIVASAAAATAAADIHCIAWENAANVRGKFG